MRDKINKAALTLLAMNSRAGARQRLTRQAVNEPDISFELFGLDELFGHVLSFRVVDPINIYIIIYICMTFQNTPTTWEKTGWT